MFKKSKKIESIESFNTREIHHVARISLFYKLFDRSLINLIVAIIVVAGITFGIMQTGQNHDLLLASFSKSVDANNFTVVTGGKWTVNGHYYELKDPVALVSGDDSSVAPTGVVGNANITTYNTTLPDQNWSLKTRLRGTDVGHPFTGYSVIFGFADISNYYFANFSSSSTSTTNGIFQIKGGIETKLANFNSTSKVNKFYNVELDKAGQSITVLNDGNQLASVVALNLGSGHVGFGSISNGVDVLRLQVTSPNPVPTPTPTPTPAPTPTPTPNPIYSCDSLAAQQTAGTQGYIFSVNTTATNGASVNSYVYNFGDGSTLVTSNQSTVSHTYSTGNFMANVEVKFNVSGQVVAVNSRSCVVAISVSQPAPTPTPTPTPTPAGSLDSFFKPAFNGTPFCHFSNQNYAISGSTLTISYAAGSSAPSAGAPYGGAQTCIPSSTGPQPGMTLNYSVRFPIGFQFVKGGKLPGLYGGVEPFSGGSHNAGGWSMRLMWRTGGAGEVYSYTANTTGYGDEYGKGNFNWQADGNWHTVSEHVTINTPGASNGSVTLTYDGKQVISQTGIDVTNTATPVSGLFFSTFYGGHDTTWSPTTNQTLDFSNFSVSAN
jgi:hypothetical protein